MCDALLISVSKHQGQGHVKQDTGQTSMGAIEQLSGRLPSDVHRPVGSRVDGTLTAALMWG